MFYLFAGDDYYPTRAPGDFIAKAERREDLRPKIPARVDWWVILDEDMRVIEESS